jgi:RHS repeat-associated protein
MSDAAIIPKTLRLFLLSVLLLRLTTIEAQEYSVGSPSSSFSVSPLGEATYSIAIEVPQGLVGAQPQISLTYNSHAGNGIAGMGCNISGISVITRGCRDIYHDGKAAGICHSADDAFYLDGTRLIETSAYSVGCDSVEYYLESDPYCRIVLHGLNNPSQAAWWFSAHTKDGYYYEYGHSDGQQLYSWNTKVNAWYVVKTLSPLGNYLTYAYFQDGLTVYIDRIEYGNSVASYNGLSNKVIFEYAIRDDQSEFSIEGERGCVRKRLSTITSKTGNAIYRTYRLYYASSPQTSPAPCAQLTSVTMENGNGDSVRPVTFQWQERPDYSVVPTVSDHDPDSHLGGYALHSEKAYASGDLDGDGLCDFIETGWLHYEQEIYQPYEHRYIYTHYSKRNADGTISFVRGNDLSFPVDTSVSEDWYDSFSAPSALDFDGDGVVDIVIPCKSDHFGQSWAGFYIVSKNGGHSGVRYVLDGSDFKSNAGDFNNDGKHEFVVIENYQSGSNYQGGILGLDSQGEAYRLDFLFSLSGFPSEWQVADMNNDGLADIVAFSGSAYTVFWNDGTWLDPSPVHTPQYTTFSTGLSGNITVARCGDFNGDGCMDFLIGRNGYSSWYIAFGNGDGSCYTCLACSLAAYAQPTSKDDDKMTCIVLDFDGDGRSDVFVNKGMYYPPLYLFGKNYSYWLRSTGSSLEVMSTATSFREEDSCSRYYMAGDFNGDGLYEISSNSFNCYSSQNADEDPQLRIYSRDYSAKDRGKVAVFTDGYGNVTSVGYKVLTDSSVYKKGSTSSPPFIDCTIPLTVVSNVTEGNGAAGNINTSYGYEGLKIHSQGRGLIGFEATTVSNSTLGTSVENRVTEWNTNLFVPKTTVETSHAGAFTSRKESRYGYLPFSTMPILMSCKKTDFDGIVTLSDYQYITDMYFAPVSEFHQTTDWVHAVYYDDYVLRGGRYLPTKTTSWLMYPPENGIPTETTYTYNEKGQIVSKTEHDNTLKALTTTYTYDSYGNVTEEQISGVDIEDVTTTYQYDPTHRFVIDKTWQGCQTLYTRNLWGCLLSETDRTRQAYPLTTNYAYDGWGRKIQEVSSSGKQTNITWGWGESPSRCYYVHTETTAQPWTTIWYDSKGREVHRESVGVGGISVSDTISYDVRGLVSRRHSTIGTLSTTENITRDVRGRVATDIYSSGRSLSYMYSGLTVTCTENGRQYVKTYDSQGNVLSATDPAGTVTYIYGSHGKPVSVTSVDGQVVTIEYDEAGNKTKLSDPDAGVMHYSYDALGRMVYSRDARGTVTTCSYDLFGNLQSQTVNGMTTTWSYPTNASDPNRGMLTAISAGIANVSYQYDSLGRLVAENWQVPFLNSNPQSFAYQYTYNSDGLLSSKTWPGTITTSYQYDDYGNKVQTCVGDESVWELDNYDGRNTFIKHGSGVVRIKNTDQNGNPYNDIMKVDGQQRYYLHYSFTGSTGNMESRLGTNIGYEHFNYDNLDRLTQVSSSHTTTFEYAPNGNLLFKTGMGRYTYGTTMPHAVREVENTGALLPRTLVTTHFNHLGKVDRIEMGANRMEIDYGPDNERVRSRFYDMYDNPQCTRLYLPGLDVMRQPLMPVRYFYYLDDGVVYVRNGSQTGRSYFIFNDHLGSIRNIVKDDGTEVFSATYDVWGLQDVTRNDLGFFRGYTGHEMLPEFGLINMNGRLYDPHLGRFLSCDNYVQEPYSSQSFNRYSYCLNNPLKYTDPDGELWWIVAAGIAGGLVNLGIKACNGQIHGWGDGLMAFGIGFAAGAVGAATGGAALSVAGGAGIGGFFGGAFSGAVGATYSTATLGIANNAYFGDPLPSNKEFLTTVFTSALTAGLINGAASSMNGKTFRMGREKMVPAMQIEPIEPVSISNEYPLSVRSENDIINWPNPDYVEGTRASFTLTEGTHIDRYAYNMDHALRGTYFSTPDVPFEMRSLPYTRQNYNLYEFEVIKPIPGVKSLARPFFNQPGYGFQFQPEPFLGTTRIPTVKQLKEQGFIKIVVKF